MGMKNYSYKGVTIVGKALQYLDLCSALMVLDTGIDLNRATCTNFDFETLVYKVSFKAPTHLVVLTISMG